MIKKWGARADDCRSSKHKNPQFVCKECREAFCEDCMETHLKFMTKHHVVPKIALSREFLKNIDTALVELEKNSNCNENSKRLAEDVANLKSRLQLHISDLTYQFNASMNKAFEPVILKLDEIMKESKSISSEAEEEQKKIDQIRLAIARIMKKFQESTPIDAMYNNKDQADELLEELEKQMKIGPRISRTTKKINSVSASLNEEFITKCSKAVRVLEESVSDVIDNSLGLDEKFTYAIDESLGSPRLLLYNIASKNIKEFSLPIPLENVVSAHHKNNIYLCGMFKDFQGLHKFSISSTLKVLGPVELPLKLEFTYGHKMCVIYPHLYIIGGEHNIAVRYHLEEFYLDSFSQMRFLRSDFALVRVNKIYLYAIGGANISQVEFIEFFSVDMEERGWSLIQLVVDRLLFEELRGLHGIQTSRETILFFGGTKDKADSDKLYEFTISTKEIKILPHLPISCEFGSSAPILVVNKVYDFTSSRTRCLLEIDIENFKSLILEKYQF